MTDWNPYENAYKRLVEKLDDETELRSSILMRLTGREADPEYNWSRNQEPPEKFYIWANKRGDDAFRVKFENAISGMIEDCFESEDPDRVDTISRLLYLAELIEARPVAKLLRDRLIKKGKISRDKAQALREMAPAPWAQTLLHQALGTLSVIESTLPKKEQSPFGFWEPLHEKTGSGVYAEYVFPPDLRLIALRAMGRVSWEKALKDNLKHAIDAFDPGKNHSITELAGLINFFIHQSKQQTKRDNQYGIIKSSPTLVAEPYPLVPGFLTHANNSEVIGMLRKSLIIISRSRKVFEGEKVSDKEWHDDYIREILEEIRGNHVKYESIRVRVRLTREAKKIVDITPSGTSLTNNPKIMNAVFLAIRNQGERMKNPVTTGHSEGRGQKRATPPPELTKYAPLKVDEPQLAAWSNQMPTPRYYANIPYILYNRASLSPATAGDFMRSPCIRNPVTVGV